MSDITNQHIGVTSCYPHPDNYQRHPPSQIERLRESLRVFGQVRSIVAQDDGQGGFVLVAGHGIHEAARQEGFDTIRADVIPTDWPAVRVKAYLAADNELARLGDPDLAQLAALAEDVASVDEKLAALAAGTEERLAELVGGLNGNMPEDPGPQVDRAGELLEKWCVELGDLWVIPSKTADGEHRVICGDCTDAAVVERIGNKHPKMVLTDPPYGVNYEGQSDSMYYGKDTKGKTREKIIGDITIDDSIVISVSALRLMVAPILFLWHAPQFHTYASDIACGAGYEIFSVIVWNKNHANFGAMGARYKPKFEMALACKRDVIPWYGPNNEVTVWDIDRSTKNEHHPTQKPVELFERAIRNHTRQSELVIDPFCGSGTTLVACERLARLGRGVEIEPKYVAVTLERLSQMGLTPQRVSQLEAV